MSELLLLDTHIWLWFLQGNNTIKAVEKLKTAAQKGHLGIPAICVWEVAMLATKGRISLGMPTRLWVETAVALPGFRFVSITPDIAIDAAELPGTFHGDPADRLIVATTRLLSGTLITRDEKILAFAKQGYVSALAG